MALPPRRSRPRVRRAEAGPRPTRRRNYHHRFPETCIFQSVLPSFHTRVDVGGFAKRVSGHVSCHPPPVPRPPTCERALFWKQPEALWSLGWRVEWVAVLRRPLSLAVRPFLQAGLGRAGDSVSKVAGASASWRGVQALGRPCAAWGRDVCSGSQFPGKAREGLWGPVLALPSSSVRDPPSQNPAGPPQFRGSSAGPWLRGGHRPVRLAPGWSWAPPSSAGLFSLQVSEVASPPRCSWRSASCSVSWRQWPVFVGVPALSACCVPPRRLWPRPPFQLCKVSKMPRAAVALQWPSRLWAPSLARSSPSFSNPQRLRLPREARPEPQPSLLRGQTSVQPSLVRVTSPRLSGACPQRPQHPTCSGKHAGAEPPSCFCRHLPWAHARSRAWMGEGPGCISAARAGGRPLLSPTPSQCGCNV